MKPINILINPVTLIGSFCLVLISGEKTGGFYLIYLLMGLIGGYLHSFLAIVGVTAILISDQFKENRTLRCLLKVVGALLLPLSLLLFFQNDTSHYNWGTFSRTASQVTLVLFGFLWLSYVLKVVMSLVSPSLRKSGKSAGMLSI
jgi:biotin transporter BioY